MKLMNSVLFVRVRLWKSSTWNTLVSFVARVAIIGVEDFLVWIVTSMGKTSSGTDIWSNVLLWLLVKSSKTLLEVSGGTIIVKGTFSVGVVPEPATVWVSMKQLSFW